MGVCKPGHRSGAQKAIKSKSPRDDDLYWIGPVGDPVDDDEVDTDFHALKNRKASITPLKTNLLDEKVIDKVKNWLEKF